MVEFNINEESLCNVKAELSYSLLDNPENPTADDLIKILKGEDSVKTLTHKDHPEFAALKTYLADNGFIKTASWWNGDSVLKPFKFNGKVFEIGEQFPCAAAMKHHIKHKN